jgi:hypothetical protein
MRPGSSAVTRRIYGEQPSLPGPVTGPRLASARMLATCRLAASRSSSGFQEQQRLPGAAAASRSSSGKNRIAWKRSASRRRPRLARAWGSVKASTPIAMSGPRLPGLGGCGGGCAHLPTRPARLICRDNLAHSLPLGAGLRNPARAASQAGPASSDATRLGSDIGPAPRVKKTPPARRDACIDSTPVRRSGDGLCRERRAADSGSVWGASGCSVLRTRCAAGR